MRITDMITQEEGNERGATNENSNPNEYLTSENDLDQFRFLRNCPPTPPLSQHFVPVSEK